MRRTSRLARAARRGGRAQRAYSLVEVMVCVVIVGGMFAAAVHTLGAVRVNERQTSERTRAHALAVALAEELIEKPYGEMEHYAGWSTSPPTRLDGTPLAGFEDWTCHIEVARVSRSVLETTAQETRLKRVSVVVRRGELLLAEITVLRGGGLRKERPTGAIAP